jgi:hypothetical protein
LAHNPKVASSNLAPATKQFKGLEDIKTSNPFFLPPSRISNGGSVIIKRMATGVPATIQLLVALIEKMRYNCN